MESLDADQTHEITRLLGLAQKGNEDAREKLLERVYQELHGIARRYAARERDGNSLQATALLHEVYLKMFGTGDLKLADRTHFFAMAARQMRHVLVDYARKRKAEKRGGEAIKFSLEDVDGAREYDPDELLAVHVALEKLEAFDAHLAHLVELKYFAGLTDHEIADATGTSFAKLRRDWDFARTWLRNKMSAGA
jgi:RNA polymerase sigma factor (TIGR02999 family)